MSILSPLMTILPASCGVMFLEGVSLFPGTQLPLRIFETRYRRMLTEALEGSRMFAIAMKPTPEAPENPMPLAGLDLITACVKRKDGTSNLVPLGGRVGLINILHETPFQAHAIEPTDTINDLDEPEKSVSQKLIRCCEARIPDKQNEVLNMLKVLRTLVQLTDQICAIFIKSDKERNRLMQTLRLKTRIETLRKPLR